MRSLELVVKSPDSDVVRSPLDGGTPAGWVKRTLLRMASSSLKFRKRKPARPPKSNPPTRTPVERALISPPYSVEAACPTRAVSTWRVMRTENVLCGVGVPAWTR